MIKKFWILIILSVSVTIQAIGQNAVATAKTDSAKYEIGDLINLKVSIEVEPKYNIYFPIIDDSIDFDMEFISISLIDSVRSKDKSKITCSRVYTFAIYTPGEYNIEGLPFMLQAPKDTNFITVFTNPIKLTITAPEIDLEKDIKDIKSPWKISITFQEAKPYVFSFLGLLLLLGLSFLFVYLRRRRKDPVYLEKKTYIPPHIEAFERLEKLRLSQLWQVGKVKEYYSELTDILKVYIERELKIPAVEMTSDELLDRIPECDLGDQKTELLNNLREILTTADLVKFAKSSPLPDEHDRCFKMVKHFVESTYPKEEMQS